MTILFVSETKAYLCSAVQDSINTCKAGCGGSPDDRQECSSKCEGIASAYMHCEKDPDVPVPIPRPSDLGSPTSSPASTASAPTPSPQELAQQCISQAQDKINSCNTNKTSATSNCDMNNSSLTGALSQAAQVAGQVTSSSVQAACSNMGSMSQGANAALTAFVGTCSNAKGNCTSACASAKSAMDQCANNAADSSAVKSAMQSMSDYQSVTSNSSTCNGLQTNIDKANQATQSMATTYTNSQNCATDTSAQDPSTIPSSDPNSAYCLANPTVASCVASCGRSDLPAVYNSQTCVCSRNPKDPSCNAAVSSSTAGSGITSQGGGVASGTTSSSSTSAADLNLDSIDKAAALNALSQIQSNNTAFGSEDQVGGRQGNGAAIGASNGGLTAVGAAKKSASGIVDAKAAFGSSNGFYGGSGGGGGLTNGMTTAAGANPRNGGLLNTTGQNTAGNKWPDLRQFLPGGVMDPTVKRGLAGDVLIGKDGVTGANGGSNWDKMQNRFRSLYPTFLP